jgi:hypothetical protein
LLFTILFSQGKDCFSLSVKEGGLLAVYHFSVKEGLLCCFSTIVFLMSRKDFFAVYHFSIKEGLLVVNHFSVKEERFAVYFISVKELRTVCHIFSQGRTFCLLFTILFTFSHGSKTACCFTFFNQGSTSLLFTTFQSSNGLMLCLPHFQPRKEAV